jgi:hypothetical protein
MTAVLPTAPSVSVAPSNDAAPAPVLRPLRRQPWPYAGLLAAGSSGASTMFLAQGGKTFARDGHAVTTDYLYGALSPASTSLIGGGLALVGIISAFVFLLGLTRFVDERHGAESWRTALRWSSVAFVASSSIGVGIRYIAAGGAPNGVDHDFYSHEASTTIAVLSDQLAYASALPCLGVVVAAGVLAFRTGVLPRTVGVVALVLAVGSIGATLGVGLPYSAALVWPLFAAMASLALLFRRRA